MAPENAGGVKDKSIGQGQKIRDYFGRDNSSQSVPNTMASKMGGSTTNLSHSLIGASANQKGTSKR